MHVNGKDFGSAWFQKRPARSWGTPEATEPSRRPAETKGESAVAWRIARCGEKERREQDEGYFAHAGATFFRSAAKEGKDEPGGPRRSTRRSLRFHRAVILRKLRIARWLLLSKPKQELRFGKDVSPESSSGDQREPRRIPANKDAAPPPLDSPLLDERRRVYERRETKDERRKTRDERRETRDERRETRDERRKTRDERRETRDERRKTKDERRKTKDERRETRDERRKTKDERRKTRDGG